MEGERDENEHCEEYVENIAEQHDHDASAYIGDNVTLDYGEGEEVEESREREDGNAQHTPIETDSIGLTTEPLLNETTEVMADDRSFTQVASPTIELANREKEKDSRRVQEAVNDSRFRQSGGAYNKDRNRQRVEVDNYGHACEFMYYLYLT